MIIEETSDSDFCGLRAEGRIDATEAGPIFKLVCDKADSGMRDIRLDTRAVDYISSAGIRALLQCARKLSSVGGSFRLSAASYNVQQSLALSGMSHLILASRQVPEAFSAPKAGALTIVDERMGQVLLLKLYGRMDAKEADRLFQQVCMYADDGVKTLRIDATNLDYMSSGGIRALLQSHRRMNELDGTMQIVSASQFVLAALTMSGLSILLAEKK
jgi:anti-anti-sigma factor